MSDQPPANERIDLENNTLPPIELLAEIGSRVQGIEINGGRLLRGVQRRSFWIGLLSVVAILAGIVSVPTAVLSIKASNRSTNAIDAVCRTAQDNRDLLGEVVISAYSQQSIGALDLRQLPSYVNLDAATKAWVDELQSLISLSGSATSPNDKNKNHIPDPIDKLLKQKVCDE